jgi:hypothetical protein
MKILALAAACASLLAATTAHATTCSIGFSQSGPLSALPAIHAAGYAQAPWYSAICGGANFVNRFLVDDNGGAGFHLLWADDPTINCLAFNATWPQGVMGRQGASCVPVNPLTTSRMAGTHGPTQYIRIRATNSNRWRPTQLKVMGPETAKVLVEHTDGTWWQYTNLTPGVWNLASTGKFARNAWVTNQNTNVIGGISFDNFVVDHQL